MLPFVTLGGGSFTISPMLLPVGTEELPNRSSFHNGGHSAKSRFLLRIREGKKECRANIPITCLESIRIKGEGKLMARSMGLNPPEERIDELPVRMFGNGRQYELSLLYKDGQVTWNIEEFDGLIEKKGNNVFVIPSERTNVKSVSYTMSIDTFVGVWEQLCSHKKQFETVHFIENARIFEEQTI